MKNYIRKNRETFKELLDNIIVTHQSDYISHLDEGFEKSVSMIMEHAKSGGKLLFIGNGGSSSIAGHMAVDFWKNGSIRALAFNDGALLTCLSNDYGYEQVFEKSIEMFAEEKDILVAISSSGKSENILRGVRAARKKGLKIITLSGFDKDNPLRRLGDINFYVSSVSYGHVEIAHLSICHCFVDTVIELRNGSIRNK